MYWLIGCGLRSVSPRLFKRINICGTTSVKYSTHPQSQRSQSGFGFNNRILCSVLQGPKSEMKKDGAPAHGSGPTFRFASSECTQKCVG